MGAPLVGAALAASIARSYFKYMELKEEIIRDSFKNRGSTTELFEKKGGKDERVESNADQFEHHTGRERTDTEIKKVMDA